MVFNRLLKGAMSMLSGAGRSGTYADAAKTDPRATARPAAPGPPGVVYHASHAGGNLFDLCVTYHFVNPSLEGPPGPICVVMRYLGKDVSLPLTPQRKGSSVYEGMMQLPLASVGTPHGQRLLLYQVMDAAGLHTLTHQPIHQLAGENYNVEELPSTTQLLQQQDAMHSLHITNYHFTRRMASVYCQYKMPPMRQAAGSISPSACTSMALRALQHGTIGAGIHCAQDIEHVLLEGARDWECAQAAAACGCAGSDGQVKEHLTPEQAVAALHQRLTDEVLLQHRQHQHPHSHEIGSSCSVPASSGALSPGGSGTLSHIPCVHVLHLSGSLQGTSSADGFEQVQAAWHQGRESGQLYTALLLTHQMQTVAILCENIDIYSDGAASNSGNSSSSGTGCSSSSSGRCSGHSQRGRCMHLFDSHQHEYGDGQADGASVLTFASADMLCHFLQQRFPQVPDAGYMMDVYDVSILQPKALSIHPTQQAVVPQPESQQSQTQVPPACIAIRMPVTGSCAPVDSTANGADTSPDTNSRMRQASLHKGPGHQPSHVLRAAIADAPDTSTPAKSAISTQTDDSWNGLVHVQQVLAEREAGQKTLIQLKDQYDVQEARSRQLYHGQKEARQRCAVLELEVQRLKLQIHSLQQQVHGEDHSAHTRQHDKAACMPIGNDSAGRSILHGLHDPRHAQHSSASHSRLSSHVGVHSPIHTAEAQSSAHGLGMARNMCPAGPYTPSQILEGCTEAEQDIQPGMVRGSHAVADQLGAQVAFLGRAGKLLDGSYMPNSSSRSSNEGDGVGMDPDDKSIQELAFGMRCLEIEACNAKTASCTHSLLGPDGWPEKPTKPCQPAHSTPEPGSRPRASKASGTMSPARQPPGPARSASPHRAQNFSIIHTQHAGSASEAITSSRTCTARGAALGGGHGHVDQTTFEPWHVSCVERPDRADRLRQETHGSTADSAGKITALLAGRGSSSHAGGSRVQPPQGAATQCPSVAAPSAHGSQPASSKALKCPPDQCQAGCASHPLSAELGMQQATSSTAIRTATSSSATHAMAGPARVNHTAAADPDVSVHCVSCNTWLCSAKHIYDSTMSADGRRLLWVDLQEWHVRPAPTQVEYMLALWCPVQGCNERVGRLCLPPAPGVHAAWMKEVPQAAWQRCETHGLPGAMCLRASACRLVKGLQQPC